jgi:hypothetical protein
VDDQMQLLTRVGSAGVAPADTRLLALADGSVLAATESALYRIPSGDTCPLDWAPAGLSQSPSRRYAMVTSASDDHFRVLDLVTGRQILDIGEIGYRGSTTGTFARVADSDVLVVSQTLHIIEVLDLPAGRSLGRADFSATLAFIFRSLHPLLDGDSVAAIGHGESESKDSLLTLSVKGLIEAPTDEVAELLARQRPADYAYSVAAGPCGADSIVVYRDPEDDEEPEEGEEPESDIENLHGFYVRRLHDSRLVQRIEYADEVASRTALFSTSKTVVVGQPGRIELLDRASDSRMSVAAEVYAFDPASSQVALLEPDGQIGLFDVA